MLRRYTRSAYKYSPQRFILHHYWPIDNIRYDVGLIRTKETINLIPYKIDSISITNENFAIAGQSVKIVGWGCTQVQLCSFIETIFKKVIIFRHC